MTWANGVRLAAFARLPKSWQPVASYHYYRVRAQLERELPLVCRVLHSGSCAVDVGANEGVYTHAFARTGAKVEAFEPHPACFDILRSYQRAHPNVTVHGEALGAEDRLATLHVPGRDGRPISSWATLERSAADEAAARFQVKVRTLDSFALPRVDVVKIDVEGRELDVVSGARRTIQTHRPVLLVEIERRHLTVPMDQVFGQIVALGYTGHFVHPRSGALTLDRFDAATYQPASNADTPGALYINNFIFTADGSNATAVLFG